MPGEEALLGMAQQMAGNIGAEALGAAQFFTGNSKLKKDRAELAALKTPFYKIQDEYLKNQNIAEQQAGQGLSTDTKNFLTEEGESGLGTSISAINAGGGNPNDIARLFDTYQKNTRAIGAEDAATHQKNIEYYMGANKDLAAQKTIQWGVNEKQPYENKLKELTERRAADEQTKWGGLSTAVTSALGAGIGGQNKDLIKGLFSKQGTTEDPFTTNTTLGNIGGGVGGSGGAYTPAAGEFPI